VSDALDMAALSQDLSAIVEAAAAGIDLLLMGPRALDIDALLERLTDAEKSESDARIIALKRWVAEHRLQPQPPLTVVGCAEHSAVAKQVAEDSITLVRDVGNLLPLALAADQRLVLVLPKLADLTPADTSSSVRHTLAEHVRRYVPRALAIEVAADPTDAEIGSVRGQLRSNDVVLLATVNARAQVGQVRLAATVLKTAGRVVVAALRMPTDLLAFPGVATYLCTYSAQEPSLSALADVLFGKLRPRGKLPVSIPGMYPVGHATHLPGPIP
jgi:beta-N-acetylhexosaminidase